MCTYIDSKMDNMEREIQHRCREQLRHLSGTITSLRDEITENNANTHREELRNIADSCDRAIQNIEVGTN